MLILYNVRQKQCGFRAQLEPIKQGVMEFNFQFWFFAQFPSTYACSEFR